MKTKTIPVRGHGQITIPKRLRERFQIEEGDLLEVEIASEGILLKPRKLIDPSQAWFWTKQWQEKEREVDEAIRAGRIKRFKGPDELIRDLHRHRKR
jgi:AbrB family looped-hinge helix DNA binding protein